MEEKGAGPGASYTLRGEILASELTTTEDGDASLVGPLLDQISGPIASVTADCAYDGDPVYRIIYPRILPPL